MSDAFYSFMGWTVTVAAILGILWSGTHVAKAYEQCKDTAEIVLGKVACTHPSHQGRLERNGEVLICTCRGDK